MSESDSLLLPPGPLDAAWVEREYNNRERVPEHPALFARWERDSAFVRETLPGSLDLAYGPPARHRIDFFPAAAGERLLVFFHGGYWRGLDKRFFSWLAPSYAAAGVSVAVAVFVLDGGDAPSSPVGLVTCRVRSTVPESTPAVGGSRRRSSLPTGRARRSAPGSP